MPQPALTRREVRRTVRLVERLLRVGYRLPGRKGKTGSVLVAAGAIFEQEGRAIAGAGEMAVRHRLKRGKSMGLEPNWAITPKPKRAPGRKSDRVSRRGRSRGSVSRRPQKAQAPVTIRVCVIPDVHLCPTHPDVSRMEWLGRWARSCDPDHIVQLGDLGTFDSVNRHAPPGTISFEKNPRMLADFDTIHRGLSAFNVGAGRLRARRHITKGNHEFRLDRFEELNPPAQGMIASRFDEIANAHGWAVIPFCEYLFLEGVGFIHHPVNSAGRPYGGKTGPGRIANDSTFSIVHGHSHTRQSVVAPKVGGGKVRVISAGCALPYGRIEDYAKHSATGWDWGALCLTIRGGAILDEEWISMLSLERRFKAGARAC